MSFTTVELICCVPAVIRAITALPFFHTGLIVTSYHACRTSFTRKRHWWCVKTERERVNENPIQKLCKGVKTVPDEVRYGSKCNWEPPVFTWWDSHGRAQSKNSSWSIATSPLWPLERCEWNWIWKDEGIRPRKMVPSLQLRTLVASGRHTTASSESWWRMEAHKGVEPRPVWSNDKRHNGTGSNFTYF